MCQALDTGLSGDSKGWVLPCPSFSRRELRIQERKRRIIVAERQSLLPCKTNADVTGKIEGEPLHPMW